MNGTFRVYQLPEGSEYKGVSYESLQRQGVELNALNYKLAYKGDLNELSETEKNRLSVSDVLVVKPVGMPSQATYCNGDYQLTMPEFFLDERVALKNIVERFYKDVTANGVDSPDGEWEIYSHINANGDHAGQIVHNGHTCCDIACVGKGFEINPKDRNAVPIVETVHRVMLNMGMQIYNATELSVLYLQKEMDELRQRVIELEVQNRELQQQLIPLAAEHVKNGLNDYTFSTSSINTSTGIVQQTINLYASDSLLRELAAKTHLLAKHGEDCVQYLSCQITIDQEDNSLVMLLSYNNGMSTDYDGSFVPLSAIEAEAVYQAVDRLSAEKTGKNLEETFAQMGQYVEKQHAEEPKRESVER